MTALDESQPTDGPNASERMPRRSLGGEVRDAISTRSLLLVVGVLVLQVGFILSYVGAFHAPKPHRISLGVVAPAQVSGRLLGQLNGLPAQPLRASTVADADTARHLVETAQLSSALVIDPTGDQDSLLVASAGGPSVVTAVEAVLTKVEAAQQRSFVVTDVVADQPGDGRGLTGFYLVLGWLVGGYLVASAFGAAKGARPANARRSAVRLLALVPYAALSGIGGMLIVDQVLGALTGHFWSLALLGAGLVFAAGAVTVALQALFGVLGVGITVLLFVILGNPSAGGAYQASLLPPFWRAISGALPNGAGVDVIRRVVYFGAHGITGSVLVIIIYAVAGSVFAILASVAQQHRRDARATTTAARA